MEHKSLDINLCLLTYSRDDHCSLCLVCKSFHRLSFPRDSGHTLVPQPNRSIQHLLNYSVKIKKKHIHTLKNKRENEN